MFRMYQIAGRFSPRGVGTWIGQHKIDPGHWFVSEEAAMEDACRRLCQLWEITRINPNPQPERSTSGALMIRDRGMDVHFRIEKVR